MRLSILELLIVIAVIAFAIVSLTRADPLFETLFFSFTLFMMLAAMLLAFGRSAGDRAFWIGFATTSSLYLMFAHQPDADGNVPRHNGPEITTQLLRCAYNVAHPGCYDTNFSSQPGGLFSVQDDPFDFGGSDRAAVGLSHRESEAASTNPFPSNLVVIGGGTQVVSTGDTVSFMRIGHSAWALLLGWIAGHVTRTVYQRSHPAIT